MKPTETLVIDDGVIVAVVSTTKIWLTDAAAPGPRRRRALLMGLFALQIAGGRRPGPYTAEAAATFATAAEQMLQPPHSR